MINVPVFPNALVTRQIKCICCHEQFTISVDEPTRPFPRTPGWHVPAGQLHSTQMRYENDRRRRPTSPTVSAVPERNLEHNPYRDPADFYFACCPRCGADNRNWLNFQQKMPFPRQNSLWMGYALIGLVVVSILVLIQAPNYLPQLNLDENRHSTPLLIAIVLSGLLPLLLIPGLWNEMRLRGFQSEVVPAISKSWSPVAVRAILIFGVLALLLPALLYVVPPFLREVRAFVNQNQEPESTLVTRIDEVSQQAFLLASPTIQEPVNNAFGGLTAVLNAQLLSCQKTQIDQMIYDLQAISATAPHGNALAVQSAINQLNVIRDTANLTCRKYLVDNVVTTLQPVVATTLNQQLPNGLTIQQCRSQWQAANEGQDVLVDPACYNFMLTTMLTDLQVMQNTPATYSAETPRAEILREVRLLAANPDLPLNMRIQITNNIATLETSLQTLAVPEPPLLNWRFLVFWFTAVTLTWLLCTLCANEAMNQRIQWLGPHVPHPIFTSVANMTRVAVWEAKQALDINDHAEQRIQWTKATRNEAGGIDLVGLFRDPPDITSEGIMSNQVRAQQYTISTDIWCRVRETRVMDVMTQRPAGGPAFATPVLNPIQVMVSDRARSRP